MSPFRVMRFEDLTDEELLQSLEAEIAKSKNELDDVEKTVDKITSRLGFGLALVHFLKERINR